MENAIFERPFSTEHLLLQELTHRVNNEFASAIGRFSVAAARSANDEVKQALIAVVKCLRDYAQVHHALEAPVAGSQVDASAYLGRLCRSISRSKLEYQGIELVFVECSLELPAERCWRLGMVVSELITNAARHAFGKGSGGAIQVELLTSESAVACRVADNGEAAENVEPGRGLKIIEALAKSLDGEIHQNFGVRGSVATLIFPRYRKVLPRSEI